MEACMAMDDLSRGLLYLFAGTRGYCWLLSLSFFHAEHLGYRQVFLNCIGMVLLFGIFALLLVAVAKYIQRLAR